MSKLYGTLQGEQSLSGALSQSMAGMKARLSEPSARIIRDYMILENKPKIESVELIGNKSFSDLGLNALENIEIESLFD